jgi:hypothetical protein
MPRNALHEFHTLAVRAGARDLPRVMASASLAIHKGMAPAAVLDSLIRNAGHLLCPGDFNRKKSARCLLENFGSGEALPARSAERCSLKRSLAAAKPHGGLRYVLRAASFRNRGGMVCPLLRQSGSGANSIKPRRQVASTAPPVLRQHRRIEK